MEPWRNDLHSGIALGSLEVNFNAFLLLAWRLVGGIDKRFCLVTTSSGRLGFVSTADTVEKRKDDNNGTDSNGDNPASLDARGLVLVAVLGVTPHRDNILGIEAIEVVGVNLEQVTDSRAGGFNITDSIVVDLVSVVVLGSAVALLVTTSLLATFPFVFTLLLT